MAKQSYQQLKGTAACDVALHRVNELSALSDGLSEAINDQSWESAEDIVAEAQIRLGKILQSIQGCETGLFL
jgi:hypothetical protein